MHFPSLKNEQAIKFLKSNRMNFVLNSCLRIVKAAQSLAALGGFQKMVEVRGVEPLSENVSTKISPGAVDSLHSLTHA